MKPQPRPKPKAQPWAPPEAALIEETLRDHEIRMSVADLLTAWAENNEIIEAFLVDFVELCRKHDATTDMVVPAAAYAYIKNLDKTVQEADQREFREIATRFIGCAVDILCPRRGGMPSPE